MVDLAVFQLIRQRFRFFNSDCANQNGLSPVAAVSNQHDYSIVALSAGAVNLIIMVYSLDRLIGRYRGNVQFIDLREFASFGHRRASHPAELFIHTEIVLESDRGQSLILSLNLHIFFGFKRLMQTIRETPAFHRPASKFINNDNAAIFQHVMRV